jgi:hypothetical protein
LVNVSDMRFRPEKCGPIADQPSRGWRVTPERHRLSEGRRENGHSWQESRLRRFARHQVQVPAGRGSLSARALPRPGTPSRSTRAFHAPSRNSAALSVDPTMSVKSTFVRTARMLPPRRPPDRTKRSPRRTSMSPSRTASNRRWTRGRAGRRGCALLDRPTSRAPPPNERARESALVRSPRRSAHRSPARTHRRRTPRLETPRVESLGLPSARHSSDSSFELPTG